MNKLSLLALAFIASNGWAGTPDVSVKTQPAQPLIETTRFGQALNFDFIVTNPTERTLELTGIEATLRDAKGNLVMQRRVQMNGGSVDIVPQRVLEPGGELLIFNPLPQWPKDNDLSRLHFELTFESEDEGPAVVLAIDPAPKRYRDHAELQLPLEGLAFVHDGHDFLGPHRRFPLLSPMARALNIRGNMSRYSLDITVPADDGALYRNEGTQREDWFGYGTPILAPAGGKVIAARNDIPDNDFNAPPKIDRGALMQDPSLIFGNRVVIDHGHGEFSVLAHLKEGSVKVKPGDTVKPGQVIGAMGMSGDANMVHLHYQLQSGPELDAEGLPAYFVNFERRTTQGWERVRQGAADSGDMLRAR